MPCVRAGTWSKQTPDGTLRVIITLKYVKVATDRCPTVVDQPVL